MDLEGYNNKFNFNFKQNHIQTIQSPFKLASLFSVFAFIQCFLWSILATICSIYFSKLFNFKFLPVKMNEVSI